MHGLVKGLVNPCTRFVDDHGTFTTFAFPGAARTQARGISGPDPILADATFHVVGLYMSAGSFQHHGFIATLSPPHLVKWDEGEWARQEPEAGAVIQQGGRLDPAPAWTTSPIVRPPEAEKVSVEGLGSSASAVRSHARRSQRRE
jgi:hypothetical protein